MLELLTKIVDDAMDEYNKQYNASVDYNNRAYNIPSLGPIASYPPLPNWIQNAIAVIRKARGENDMPIDRSTTPNSDD